MYPGRQQTGITEFLLCRDNGVCAYCKPNADPTDLVQVKLTNGLEANYTTHLVSVGGEFTVITKDSKDGEEEQEETVEEAEKREKEKYGGVFYHIKADVLR